jgi:hypothetical protein
MPHLTPGNQQERRRGVTSATSEAKRREGLNQQPAHLLETVKLLQGEGVLEQYAAA